MNERIGGKARFYIMVGIPGSGKTSYARRHLAQALRVSLDDLRLMMTGRPIYFPVEPAVVVASYALLDALLARASASRRDVLLDATNVTRAGRRRYIRVARAHNISPVAVFVDCPVEQAVARDRLRPNPVGEAVVLSFHRRLQPPATNEGFDEVVHVTTTSP